MDELLIRTKPPFIGLDPKPLVWTIAASDSGACAGIQADLKTIEALACHAKTVITGVTAQNSNSVEMVQAVDSKLLEAQLNALAKEALPRVIKLGALGSIENLRVVVDFLASLPAKEVFVVVDPVLGATSGASLCGEDRESYLKEFKEKIIPLADLLSPNLEEAELLGLSEDACELDNSKLGGAVYIKGGHAEEGDLVQDYFSDHKSSFWLSSPRIDSKNTRGTGCTFASAVSAALAHGYHLHDAVVIAKSYINQAIRTADPEIPGAMNFGTFPNSQKDLPWLSSTKKEALERSESLRGFPSCVEKGERIGFYPIVSSLDLFKRLIDLGVKTIQLRLKNDDGNLSDAELEDLVRDAIDYARNREVKLFVNDYWRLAIKYGAYGVHLGQSDLDNLFKSDLRDLEASGLRLGISTHTHSEVARAHFYRPSYIACGPIFPTTTKDMPFETQGLEGLRYWAATLDYPIVAIAGIFLDNAQDVLGAGASGIAVVRDVSNAEELELRVEKWSDLRGSPVVLA